MSERYIASVAQEVEDMARRLCAADGVDPDHQNRISYPSYVMGGRAWMPGAHDGSGKDGTPPQAPRQFIDAWGPPAWVHYYKQAKAMTTVPSAEPTPSTPASSKDSP